MPELPEVETTRRGVEPHVVSQRVARVEVRQPRLRYEVSPELAQCLTGSIIRGVTRRAKYLLFETDHGRLMIHLGMSGSLRLARASSVPGKHDHIDIGFANGSLLRFHDPRRFGSMLWLPDRQSHPLLDSLGPEPLSEDFSVATLYERSRRRSVPVKSFIMDSHTVAGVGNIYANEALYRAGIRPDRPAMGISRGRYGGLVHSIKDVLAEAIVAGGTTLRDFVREDGRPGYFRSRLDVYGRGGEPCLRCRRSLKEIRLTGRSTVFCSRCQR